jgi:hypothetical protein
MFLDWANGAQGTPCPPFAAGVQYFRMSEPRVRVFTQPT